MQYETIRLNIENDVAILMLDRPGAKNALNTQMRAEILHAVKAAEKSARALAITGNGATFCAGQDLGDQAKIDDIDLERTLREEYDPMFEAIFNCRIPTLAAVNGAAAGVGASLALAGGRRDRDEICCVCAGVFAGWPDAGWWQHLVAAAPDRGSARHGHGPVCRTDHG